MASINTMVKQCAGLLGTPDVNEWEQRFITDVKERTSNGDNTSMLTEKQVESLERIWRKHFSG